MERKNSSRNSGARACARVALGVGFRRCCLRTGKYDGTNRDYFFPGVEKHLRIRRKNGRLEITLTFAFYSPIVRAVEETGNGPGSCKTGRGVKRQPAPLPLMALTGRLPSVENSEP